MTSTSHDVQASILANVQDAVTSVIVDRTPRYIPSRYPWTYSADFVRSHPEIIPEYIRCEVPRP